MRKFSVPPSHNAIMVLGDILYCIGKDTAEWGAEGYGGSLYLICQDSDAPTTRDLILENGLTILSETDK
jgi:hypothetical protein